MVTVAGDSIIGIVGATIAIIVLVANAVYINGVINALNQPNNNSNLSATGATVIFWIDVILAIAFAAYLIYNLWRIFTTPEQRQTVKQAVVTTRQSQLAPPIVVAPVAAPVVAAPVAAPVVQQVAAPAPVQVPVQTTGGYQRSYIQNVPTRVTEYDTQPDAYHVTAEYNKPEFVTSQPLAQPVAGNFPRNAVSQSYQVGQQPVLRQQLPLQQQIPMQGVQRTINVPGNPGVPAFQAGLPGGFQVSA